jgi:hypothetical protein
MNQFFKNELDSLIERTGFSRFAIDTQILSEELKQRLTKLPKIRDMCRVKGRGFKGMWEPGIVVGYVECHKELKALVLYTELNNEQGLEYEFIGTSRIKPSKDAVLVRNILNLRLK